MDDKKLSPRKQQILRASPVQIFYVGSARPEQVAKLLKPLFSAIPQPDPDLKMNRIILKGDIPSPANPPKGCRFHTRCPYATDKCKEEVPEYKDYGNGHFVACHLLQK